jgi:hypothetical protein
VGKTKVTNVERERKKYKKVKMLREQCGKNNYTTCGEKKGTKGRKTTIPKGTIVGRTNLPI